ncbi:hypothetical protein VTK56DRAFT_3105 [Thermocarpiscus australiensis]
MYQLSVKEGPEQIGNRSPKRMNGFPRAKAEVRRRKGKDRVIDGRGDRGGRKERLGEKLSAWAEELGGSKGQTRSRCEGSSHTGGSRRVLTVQAPFIRSDPTDGMNQRPRSVLASSHTVQDFARALQLGWLPYLLPQEANPKFHYFSRTVRRCRQPNR